MTVSSAAPQASPPSIRGVSDLPSDSDHRAQCDGPRSTLQRKTPTRDRRTISPRTAERLQDCPSTASRPSCDLRGRIRALDALGDEAGLAFGREQTTFDPVDHVGALTGVGVHQRQRVLAGDPKADAGPATDRHENKNGRELCRQQEHPQRLPARRYGVREEPREDFTVIRAVLAVIALCAVPIAGFSEEYCRETDDHGECHLREEGRTRDFVREARISACRQLATKAHQATGTDELAAILGAMNSHCAGRTAPRGQCGAWTLTEDCPRTSPGGDSTS